MGAADEECSRGNRTRCVVRGGQQRPDGGDVVAGSAAEGSERRQRLGEVVVSTIPIGGVPRDLLPFQRACDVPRAGAALIPCSAPSRATSSRGRARRASPTCSPLERRTRRPVDRASTTMRRCRSRTGRPGVTGEEGRGSSRSSATRASQRSSSNSSPVRRLEAGVRDDGVDAPNRSRLRRPPSGSPRGS